MGYVASLINIESLVITTNFVFSYIKLFLLQSEMVICFILLLITAIIMVIICSVSIIINRWQITPLIYLKLMSSYRSQLKEAPEDKKLRDWAEFCVQRKVKTTVSVFHYYYNHNCTFKCHKFTLL